MPSNGIRQPIPHGTDSYKNAMALLDIYPAVEVTCRVWWVGYPTKVFFIESRDVPGNGLKLSVTFKDSPFDHHSLVGLIMNASEKATQ